MSEPNEQNQQNNNSAYQDKLIEGHSYDGIVEYDNPMPLWWKAVFVLTVIWSPIYIGLLDMGIIPSYFEELHDEDVYWQDKIAKLRAEQPELTPEQIEKEMESKERAAKGATIFQNNCAACHGDKGQGVIGPNLTDKFWLHGGHPIEIYHTISNGVLAKGMPAWGSVLGPNDLVDVAAFVHSLKNTNVPGKAPQGDPLVEDGDGGAAPDGDAKEGEAKPEGDADPAAADGEKAGEKAADGAEPAAGENKEGAPSAAEKDADAEAAK